MKQIILLLLSLVILLGNIPAVVFAMDAQVPSSETTASEAPEENDLSTITDSLSESLPPETEESGTFPQETTGEESAVENPRETSDAQDEEAAAEEPTCDAGDAFSVSPTEAVETETVPVTENETTVPDSTVPAEQIVTEETAAAITGEENHLTVDVHEYISLGDKCMFLVTARWEDKVLSYGGENTMFYSSRYTLTGVQEAGAYCWLVISTDEMNCVDAVRTAALATIVEAAEAAAVTAVRYDCDINQSAKVDVNDAQLACDMYNTAYMDFSDNLPMLKFLEADITADRKLDVNDPAAVIHFIVNSPAN